MLARPLPGCRLVLLLVTVLLAGCESQTPVPAADDDPLAWPEVQPETRPWSRWWWHGSAVEEADLTVAMETYAEAGLGGLEITPIYGVAGEEDQFIDYLSPEWIERLAHTLAEAERLGLGIDMATGTGWPFGGPQVSPDDAAKYVAHQTYTLVGGERLSEPIVLQQTPFVRAVGTQIYELHGFLRAEGETTQGTVEQPLQRRDARDITIDQLVEPISANENLQALALDQVRFEKDMPLQALVAYSEAGDVVELTDRVDAEGQLDWTAPEGIWTLYAVFQGWHGKNVERAAPGAEGYVIDHFSEDALTRYLQRFDSAFAGANIGALRGFFNDSYEVDDARGEADWTPDLLGEFETRRGYDLRDHFPALFGQADDETNRRVLSDFRETISDLLLDEFTTPWKTWAHGYDAIVRNQAHGSPANILDLYAASDIPETEGTELLRIKMASSAAHVTGKPLASAEAATWLNEHFLSSPADLKASADRYLLGGVNHLVYHGTAFSPADEPWPGRLFYAAVHVTPVNPLWTDFAALNAYITRIQSFMQDGPPDNDALLYYPIYDRFAEPGEALIEHFDGGIGPFEGTALGDGAAALVDHGYGFDFISDRQLQAVSTQEGRLSAGDASYRVLVVPESRYIPLETFEQILSLAEAGATVVAYRGLPAGVPGLHNLDERRDAFRARVEALSFSDTPTPNVREARHGDGSLLVGDDLPALMMQAGVPGEPMVDNGLQYIRRRHDDGHSYFIVHGGDAPFDGPVALTVPATAVARFDPMTGRRGRLPVEAGDSGVVVHLQLDPGESTILRTYDREVEGPQYGLYEAQGPPQPLVGSWTVTFERGGPDLPEPVETETLSSWTGFAGEATAAFSGTATYRLTFPRPEAAADGWYLDLGTVHESAVVRLNGQPLGTLIGPTFRLYIDGAQLEEENTLEVDVTNLMANRIADMDRRGVPWKKFYNVNFPARLGTNRNENGLFDASEWPPLPSGLMGPVTLTPVSVQ